MSHGPYHSRRLWSEVGSSDPDLGLTLSPTTRPCLSSVLRPPTDEDLRPTRTSDLFPSVTPSSSPLITNFDSTRSWKTSKCLIQNVRNREVNVCWENPVTILRVQCFFLWLRVSVSMKGCRNVAQTWVRSPFWRSQSSLFFPLSLCFSKTRPTRSTDHRKISSEKKKKLVKRRK